MGAGFFSNKKGPKNAFFEFFGEEKMATLKC
jgi:hypothetical protein